MKIQLLDKFRKILDRSVHLSDINCPPIARKMSPRIKWVFKEFIKSFSNQVLFHQIQGDDRQPVKSLPAACYGQ